MSTGTGTTEYAERLHVPLRWWVQATMFLATVWLAFTVALPPWLAWAASGALLAAVFGIFAWVGSSRVEVRDGVLYAGPAQIALEHLGAAEALDKDATRRVHGVEANARAFLHTRPYISRAVRVPIDDPSDPTPYWLISTRHPRTLAAALTRTSAAEA
ncbi:MAG: DUF3093 domain-containing protein [Propionibacteriales bacterium]|nr:DUF3093 domain-containing protein [Propionibacteriales bacterium]